MRISDWSSDVCSSDLESRGDHPLALYALRDACAADPVVDSRLGRRHPRVADHIACAHGPDPCGGGAEASFLGRSEEHTSELQSLMRISYAVFCLKKKKKTLNIQKAVDLT